MGFAQFKFMSIPVFAQIDGLVTACDWDVDGKPIRVKICSHGELDYFVLENGKGRDLFDCIREWVHVEGTVSDVNGIKIIDVETISKHKLGGRL